MNVLFKAEKAKLEIDILRKESPSFSLWDSISSQLDYILNDFDSSGNFKKTSDVSRVKQIIIGVQSVREIESGNSKLADLLCEVDYEYKELYGLVN